MNKKIKIIELYNLIANEENLPQRIVFRGVIYNWDSGRYLHYEDKISNEESFLEGICTEMVLNDYIEILNDEALEDNTEEIEELGEYSDLILMSENERVLFNMIKVTTHKVDEIIRKLNKLNTNKD